MLQPQARAAPYLVVLSPGPDQGQRFDLAKQQVVVGRAATCDVRLDDPCISRKHATLWQQGEAVFLHDLGSTGGTSVNGAAVTAARKLHSGDIVGIAAVQLRYESGDAPDEARVGAAPSASIAPPVRYDIGDQRGQAINNVAGDQRIAYVQHINQQRENFFRDIAATKTKARWLVWTGLLLYVVGFSVFAAGVLGFIKLVGDTINGGDPGTFVSPFGRDVAGVPSGLLGSALAALGTMLLVIGIVLHVVATSRRKRIDRDLPVPSPWSAPTHWEGER